MDSTKLEGIMRLMSPATPVQQAAPPTRPVPPGIESIGAATILLLDSVKINRQLLKGILKAGHYRILEASQPWEAFQLLEQADVDLIIADIIMPEIGCDMQGGLEFCRRIKANRRTRLIPILILTNVQGNESVIASLESGADEFLVKPLQPAVVRTRIRTMLRSKRTLDSLEEAETILFAMAETVEQRDKETGNHCQRLASLSVAFGAALGLPDNDLLALYRGGYLHDIGKIAIPDAILFKRGALNEEEWDVMRSHTVKGEAICHRMRSLAHVLPVIRNHHEKWDGSGYPDGQAGEQIPLLARILQLADIYDALTSCRSYKTAFSHEEAVAMLRKEASMNWRDPELVSVFVELIRQPNFIANSAALLAPDPFPAHQQERESADLQSMRESLVRMSREVLK